MSLQNSFNKIRRNAGIKKCVMINGQVGDVEDFIRNALDGVYPDYVEVNRNYFI